MFVLVWFNYLLLLLSSRQVKIGKRAGKKGGEKL